MSHTPDEPQSLGQYNGHEIYPMPFFATLAVDDPAALARWYVAALGFGVVFEVPGQLVHVRRRKYQDVLIVPAGPAGPAGAAGAGGPGLSFDASGEVDDLARRAAAVPPLGASVVASPVDTPWNTRDLRITDPAGNKLVFTSPREVSPEEAEHWRKLFEAGRKQ